MSESPTVQQGAPATVERLLERFDDGAQPQQGPVRDEVVASWIRSAAAGLSPDRLDVPFDPDVDRDRRLCWAAGSVIDWVATDQSGARVGLVLTDGRGQIVDRRARDTATRTLMDGIQSVPGFVYSEEYVGTNSIGTSIKRRGPSVLNRPEHFADAMTLMACAATTVTDPATGRIIGVVNLSCEQRDVNPLMLPLVKRGAFGIDATSG